MEKPDTTTSSEDDQNHPEVEVFGSLFCPYSKQALRLLDEKGVEYRYREVPMIFGWKLPLKNYLEMKRRSNGQKKVPQVFIGGEYFGDEETLFAGDRDGSLDATLGRSDQSDPGTNP